MKESTKRKKHKELLLTKRMDELGLGYTFNRYFLRYPQGNNILKPLEPSPTLAEFFKNNSVFRNTNQQHFIVRLMGQGFLTKA